MTEKIEETSYDLLEWFPLEICQDIFNYLDANDVLKASAVNKKWYWHSILKT